MFVQKAGTKKRSCAAREATSAPAEVSHAKAAQERQCSVRQCQHQKTVYRKNTGLSSPKMSEIRLCLSEFLCYNGQIVRKLGPGKLAIVLLI